ncbi:MAG: tetratricopeptide repeat protein [Gammaproteobacteria bacterium]|nr:tetratricopeptide repeat protein [Gammaproteobacteria bacterium]
MSEETVHNSGKIMSVKNDLEQALELHRAGQLDMALNVYFKILRVDPGHADGNHLAGLALLARKQSGDLQQSLKYLTEAIRRDDTQSSFYNDLGNAHWNLGNINDAAEAFSSSIKLDPDFIQPQFNLANCYWFQGEFKQARQAYDDALAVNEDWIQARYMLANCEYALGNNNTAISTYHKVLATRPDFIDAELGLACALLRSGQWHEGWHHFESRLQFSEFALYQSSKRPQWDGSDIRGESLLVFAEQGIGDTLHFVRYLALLKPKVGRLALVCDSSQHSLFGQRSDIDELIKRDAAEIASIEESYDYRISLMSLPNLLHTTVSTVWKVPYIESDQKKGQAWASRLATDKLKVGLVWAGNPSQKDDKFRSCKLKNLLPLMQLDQIQFYSLQVGNAGKQIQSPDFDSMIDLANELYNFEDTAAVIDALDLVISVDTAVAHLAGALGKPVWTMLWYSHCWRYLESRTDTPWYPTMRLFRQNEIGEWADVVDQIVVALIDLQKNLQ